MGRRDENAGFVMSLERAWSDIAPRIRQLVHSATQ